MRRQPSDTERLIEEGLNRYGSGDVEGALDAWERALDVEPDNPQAASYVEYVKANWDVLTGVPDGDDSAQDYGFSDDPEYQIEILPGQLQPGEPAPMHLDPHDQGWMLQDETMRNADIPDGLGGLGDLGDESDAAMTLELDADEPEISLEGDEPEIEIGAPTPTPTPLPMRLGAGPALAAFELEGDEDENDEDARPALELEADEPDLETDGGTASGEYGTLDDATSEYRPPEPRTGTQDFDSPTKEFAGRHNEATPTFGAETTPTPGFGPEATPVGFNTMTTALRKRDLGFVQPRDEELKVSLRTPQQSAPASAKPVVPTAAQTLPGPGVGPRPVVPMPARTGTKSHPPVAAKPAAPPAPPPPPPEPRTLTAPGDEGETSFADLIDSLPSPRQPTQTTRDMPEPKRAPAALIGAADTLKPGAVPRRPSDPPANKSAPRLDAPTPPPANRSAPRLDAPTTPPANRSAPRLQQPDPMALGTAPTRELGTQPATKPASAATTQKLPPQPEVSAPPLLSNPTRDLGLRPSGAPPKPVMDIDLDDQSTTAAPSKADAAVEPTGPLDPIDLRCAQILKEVDSEAPPNETVDDRTRRRITSLLDRALAWQGISDYDKAVCAAELALSEDANSAVAQKLVQRNRDTILAVFANYIGDLQRIPALAKPLHQLSGSSISPRAAFLLSRVDGLLSIDELLDVSGMPRLEAYRYLCQLFLRGILR